MLEKNIFFLTSPVNRNNFEDSFDLNHLLEIQQFTDKKMDLVLLMTPYIITNHTRSRAVTEEFREKVEGIKKELEKKGKK